MSVITPGWALFFLPELDDPATPEGRIPGMIFMPCTTATTWRVDGVELGEGMGGYNTVVTGAKGVPSDADVSAAMTISIEGMRKYLNLPEHANVRRALELLLIVEEDEGDSQS